MPVTVHPAPANGTSPVQETLVTVAATGATETIDITSGAYQALTLDANCVLSFPTPAAGSAWSFTMELIQDATGSRSVTWPGSVVWPGAAVPTLTTTPGRSDIFTFVTRDGGTKWRGFVAGLNFA